MNVMELCLSPDLGGLELYMDRCVVMLDRDHCVTACVNPDGKLHERLTEHPDTQMRKLKPATTFLPLLKARRLARMLDAEHIDVVHMHWGKDLALAAFAKMLSARKPALLYTRHMKITRPKNDPYHRFIYTQVDLMLTISRQLEREARHFIGSLDDRVATLYNGTRPPSLILSAEETTARREKAGFTRDDFVIGLFGRLENNKGQHLLVEAVSMANREGIDIKGLIVGHEMKPGYRQELQDLAAKEGIGDRIVFRDFTTEPQQLMQLCNCVLLATLEETFGVVLPEAMHAGVAVIGSDRGGVPEIIDDMQTGLLFESGNVSSLYVAIRRLYDNPEFRNRLAAAGREKAEREFSEKGHFLSLEKHFREVANRCQARTKEG